MLSLLSSEIAKAKIFPSNVTWNGRPAQFLALTFEGPLANEEDRLAFQALIPVVSKGSLPCSAAVPVTFFVSDCERHNVVQMNQLRILAAAGHEIGLLDQANLSESAACLKAATNLTGLRSDNASSKLSSTAASMGLSYVSSPLRNSQSLPYDVSTSKGIMPQIPSLDASSLSIDDIRSKFDEQYIGQRGPIVLSVTALLRRFSGLEVTSLITGLLKYQEVVAITVNKLQLIMKMKNGRELDKLTGICRLVVPVATNAVTVIRADKLANGRTAANTISSSKTNGAALVNSDPTSGVIRKGRSIVAQISQITSRFMPKTTLPILVTNNATNAISGLPKSQTKSNDDYSAPTIDDGATPTPTNAISKESSHLSASDGDSQPYVAIYITICGVGTAVLVAVAYKVYNRAERFPAIITGGYAFDAEDRDIFDLEEASAGTDSGDYIIRTGSPSFAMSVGSARTFSDDALEQQ
jgi:hypothetical protein